MFEKEMYLTIEHKVIYAGDILDVGYGISAEVVTKVGKKYYLRFTNGEEGLFTETSIQQGVFRRKAKYLGAMKKFKDGFNLVITSVDLHRGRLQIEYRHNKDVIARGWADSYCFEGAMDLHYNIGDPFYMEGIELKIIDINIKDFIFITVSYEPLGTTTCFVANTYNLSDEKRAIFCSLFWRSKTFYITKDGKIIFKDKSYDLKDGVKLIQTYEYGKNYIINDWVTEEEYFNYLSTQESSDFGIGRNLLFQGNLYEIIAIPSDNKNTRILRCKSEITKNRAISYGGICEISIDELRNEVDSTRLEN